MRLSAGSTIGPYEILGVLGSGGMGEVYRARDPRLDRLVAVKVLPDGPLSRAAEERFEREARALSHLSHPFICAIHDVGQQGGMRYLVMEYLQGETLARRIRKGRLGLPDALRYAREIAEALDTAHRHGIVHRDLKPANVMLTKSGAKLIDFGLVAASGDGAEPGVDAATATRPLTEEGAIVGTFPYMSPEQAEGKGVDARSDVFSFGAVLFEMITGRRAFEGDSRTSLVAAVLERDVPAPSMILPAVPAELDRIVATCLAKDPDRRWQSMHDVAVMLKGLEAQSESGLPRSVSGRRTALPWALAALAVLVALAAVTAAWRRRPESATWRLSVPLPPGQFTYSHAGSGVAIAPDGSLIAYFTYGRTSPMYLRPVDRFTTRAMPGTEGGYGPFFSPDAKFVGFFTDRGLHKVSVQTGAVTTLVTSSASGRGGWWAEDGFIYFASRASSGLSRISAAGGTVETLTTPDGARHENSHRWPQVLPGGREVLFTIRYDSLSTFDDATIAVLSLDDGTWTPLLRGGSFARLVGDHLVFGRAGALFAVAYDRRAKAIRGTPERVIDGVATSGTSGATEFAVSRTGTLVFSPGGASTDFAELIWVNKAGQARPASPREALFEQPAASPDGRRVAIVVGAANDSVHVLDLERDTLTRVSFEPGDSNRVTWTPDGRGIIHAAYNNEKLVLKGIEDGSSRVLLTSKRRVTISSSSPSGWIAWNVATEDGFDVHAAKLDAQPLRPIAVAATPFNELNGALSPDGRWIAFQSDESGQFQIYVRRLAGSGRWQVSSSGGSTPKWSPTGRELFYRFRDKVFSVDVREGTEAPFGKPRFLFEKPYFACLSYDVSPSGEELLMCRQGASSLRSPHLNIETNFLGAGK